MSGLFEGAECFRVVLADPPWQYANFGQAKHGAAKCAYGDESELMSFEELAALPVGRWAADDSVLVLWATWPKLDEAIDLMAAWGFAYVSGFPWVKTVPSSGEVRCGIGFWTQSASEVVLVGRSGDLVREVDAPRVRGLLVGDESVFYAPIGSKHSEKPLGIHEWIEATLKGPYVELFARKAREGWETWGHELGTHLSREGVSPWRRPQPTSTAPAAEGVDA